MRLQRAAWLAAALGLAACVSTGPTTPPPPRVDPPTKGFPTPAEIYDSVYLPVDRSAPAPPGYGLYSVLLTRAADRRTVHVLSELFRTTSSDAEASMARVNLNLIVIPVKNAGDATRTLAPARNQPAATAAAVLQSDYDFGRAAQLMASVCNADRGAAVMKVCGSAAPDGPLLVTTSQRLLGGTLAPGQHLLIVNLSTTQPQAVGEVLAAYRRQIMSKDYTSRAELDGWRLWALNKVLDASTMLPGLSKAYAGIK